MKIGIYDMDDLADWFYLWFYLMRMIADFWIIIWVIISIRRQLKDRFIDIFKVCQFVIFLFP